ncbi:uncharacterized protein LOC100370798 [Saccoglossus kowalevskii]|uniref:Uncharacterized protein LOC100370798 n=1 Tax=Saccoglossus kowalevskii TaxID=10224 RepID=A0ABM0GMW1_SACKO|nr:PREDICTED: uncharacterized protein LOC100370798 [Saccoglossus kowalevskii]
MAAAVQEPGDDVQKILLTQGDVSENPTPIPDHVNKEMSPSVMPNAVGQSTGLLEEKLKESLRVDDNESTEYISPIEDPYTRAVKYLERYNVMHIFQQLTASLVFHRPEDPLQFLLDEILKIQKEKEATLAE